jgi:hypothetical protein
MLEARGRIGGRRRVGRAGVRQRPRERCGDDGAGERPHPARRGTLHARDAPDAARRIRPSGRDERHAAPGQRVAAIPSSATTACVIRTAIQNSLAWATRPAKRCVCTARSAASSPAAQRSNARASNHAHAG